MTSSSAAVTLRVAEPSDAICIAVLATQVFLDTYATEGIRLSIAQEALQHFSPSAISERIADSSTTFIVAESSSHLVGFAQLTVGPAHLLVPAEATAELDRLYVHERFSGKGIGTALLRRTEHLASVQGASTLWLTAWVGNHRALAFYAVREYTDLGATMYLFQDEQFENRVLAKSLHARTEA